MGEKMRGMGARWQERLREVGLCVREMRGLGGKAAGGIAEV